MRRKERPPEVEPMPDRAEILELVERIVAAFQRGENPHCHPLVYELNELCNVPEPGMYVTAVLRHPSGPMTDARAMVDHIMRLLPSWLEGARDV